MRQHFLILLIFFSCHSFASEEMPDLSINKIDEGVFLHLSFHREEGFGLVSSNGLVVVNDGKAFIVDTPWSIQDTAKLVSWIYENDYQLLGSISTHSHEDRTAGIKWLNEHSISTYATTLTNNILKAKKKEPVKYALQDNDFMLADGLIEVFYPGAGHTVDNVVVWLPKSKILFGGCFVRSLGSKSLGYTGEAHVAQWSGSVKNVLNKYQDAKIVIPGHGKTGDIALLKHTKRLSELASKKSIQSTANTSVD